VSMLFGLALHEDNRATIGRARCRRCSTSSLPPPPTPALYAMCRGSLRFHSLTRAAGADKVLRRMAEERGGVRREMARKTLHAVLDLDEENDLYAAASSAATPPSSDAMVGSRSKRQDSICACEHKNLLSTAYVAFLFYLFFLQELVLVAFCFVISL
jgi:hypothetical protein